MRCEFCGNYDMGMCSFTTPLGYEIDYTECPKCGAIWVESQIDGKDVLIQEGESDAYNGM